MSKTERFAQLPYSTTYDHFTHYCNIAHPNPRVLRGGQTRTMAARLAKSGSFASSEYLGATLRIGPRR